MSATDTVSPTLDEMIFAISQIEYNTVHRPSSPSTPSVDRLSASLDSVTETSPTGDADTGATATDGDADDSKDDSDSDEDGDGGDQGMAMGFGLGGRHPKKPKHLVLLDLLALLLVTQTKSDVAATMLITNGSMKLFYCKNRPFTDGENEYVRTLFKYASQTNREASERYGDLLAVIVDKCQQKIKARLSKVLRRVKELRPTVNRGIQSESCLPLELAKRLKAQLEIGPEASLKNSLIRWCDYLERHRHSKDPEFLRFAVGHAHIIGLPPDINVMIDQKLLRRIRKLGDYMGAVIQLVGEADQLRPEALRALVIHEVPPPPPEQIVIEKTSVEIVNQWGRHRNQDGEPVLTEMELRTQFPSLPQPLSQRNTVTRSVHCECTLVINVVNYLVQQRKSFHMTLEVGVSKSLCNLCQIFLGLVRKYYPNITIMVSTHHGKNVAGWRLPPLTPLEISRGVEDHVNSYIGEIRCKALRERRSDSEPRVPDTPFGEAAANAISKVCKRPVGFSWEDSD